MTADLTRLATETIEDHAVNAHPDDDLAQDTFDGRMRTREPLLAAGVLDLTRQLAEAREEIDQLRERVQDTANAWTADLNTRVAPLAKQIFDARAEVEALLSEDPGDTHTRAIIAEIEGAIWLEEK